MRTVDDKLLELALERNIAVYDASLPESGADTKVATCDRGRKTPARRGEYRDRCYQTVNRLRLQWLKAFFPLPRVPVFA